MATKKFLFKNTSGAWVFGSTINSICPAGAYRLDVQAGGAVTVRHIYNKDIADQYGTTHSDFKKADGNAYASLAELIAATVGFFVEPSSFGGPDSQAMTAGRLGTHGEITSLAEAFSLGEGKYFSVCVVPKVASTESILVAAIKLFFDTEASNFPLPINDWTPGIISEIPATAIDTTNYYIFWAY
jgi:hypothetical protein